MSELCKSCARQNICGNNITKYNCTGYMPYVETRWDADDIKTPPFTQAQKKLIKMTEDFAKKRKKINAEVSKWGRKFCDVDDDL